MLVKPIPVVSTDGTVVGYVAASAHKQATLMLGSYSAKQGFREVNGYRVLCWVAA